MCFFVFCCDFFFSSLPLIPLFPFIRVLLQFYVCVLHFLCNLFYSPSGGVKHSISLVVVRQLMTQILHVSNPFLTQSQRSAFPEESLKIRLEMLKCGRHQNANDDNCKWFCLSLSLSSDCFTFLPNPRLTLCSLITRSLVQVPDRACISLSSSALQSCRITATRLRSTSTFKRSRWNGTSLWISCRKYTQHWRQNSFRGDGGLLIYLVYKIDKSVKAIYLPIVITVTKYWLWSSRDSQ